MVSLGQFIRLSEALTGEAALDERLANEYLERLVHTPEAKALPKLVAAFEQAMSADGDSNAAIKERILAHDDLRALAVVIVLLWYLGEIHGSEPVGGHPEHYFQGLFWKIVHAHPPALSGGYSGYWAYPPEN
jgi:Membrane bound FAD containing D-sorbitol dehydrogenase